MKFDLQPVLWARDSPTNYSRNRSLKVCDLIFTAKFVKPVEKTVIEIPYQSCCFPCPLQYLDDQVVDLFFGGKIDDGEKRKR